jgi:hypothetical protein
MYYQHNAIDMLVVVHAPFLDVTVNVIQYTTPNNIRKRV